MDTTSQIIQQHHQLLSALKTLLDLNASDDAPNKLAALIVHHRIKER